MLISGVGYLIAIWNFNQFDNYMVTRLFKIEKPPALEKGVLKSWGDKSEFMVPQILYNPKDCVRDFCPNFVCSRIMRSNRLERGFERARDKLEKEINIIEIIKSRRYFNRALKVLLPKKQRMKIKERSRYIAINPDAESENEEDKKAKQQEDGQTEFTDGFYSSDSDTEDLHETLF